MKRIAIYEALSRVLLAGLLVSLLMLAACGGGSSTTSKGVVGQASSITIGDAPADSVVSYEITVNSLTLTGSAGSVNAITTPRRLEMTHLSATVETLALLNIPNGTYTQAVIAWSSPEVTFIDAVGVLHEVQSSASGTATVPINITVSGASVLNFDLNVGASTSVNTAAGTAVLNTPVFTLTPLRSIGEAEREAETGELENIVGSVVSASATSLTIGVGESGTSMTFTVSTATKLEGISTTSALVANQIVRVEGTSQADGSMLAKEIEVESADGNGVEVEGLVTSITGTSFTMIVDDSSGQSTTSASLGKSITISAPAAGFSVGKTKINVGSLTFASIADLHKGQRVEVDSDTAKTAGAGTVNDDGAISGAKKIKLEQQSLTGVVSAITSAGFTLTLPTESAFAKLANVTSVVVVNNGAQMKNGATISAGATLRVRGLVFATAGAYTMAAGRITTP